MDIKNYKKKKPYKRFIKDNKKYKKMSYNITADPKKGGFSDTYFCNLTYINSQVVLGDNTAVGNVKSLFLSDPTLNNTIFPQGWTLLREIYDIYLVHAAKIEVTFQNLSTTVPMRVMIAPYDQDSANFPTIPGGITLSNFNLMAGSGYSKETNLSIAGGCRDTASLTLYWSNAKFSGHGNTIKPTESRFIGNCGGANSSTAFSQPTNNYRLAFGAITGTGANLATAAIYCTFKITYYMQFAERLAGTI